MPNLKTKILLIYTGGTIGMVKDYATGGLRAFNFEELIVRIPELQQLACDIETHSFENPIDSSDMNPKHWASIANTIANEYLTYDGFVILHGSDTMSYTASALSFMLENLTKPVIITGSQLPIGDLRTDAKENLITAIQIAALQENSKSVVQEVGLYFEYKLYRGNRTTKINAEHFQAFASLNYPHLIESGVHLSVNHEHLHVPLAKKQLVVHTQMDNRVAILKLFPGISINLIQKFLDPSIAKAIILETYGAGNASTNPKFLNLLKTAIASGIHIINVTQCSGGSVLMGQYNTSTELKNLQVINGKDITTEAAVTKAMYMLGSRVSPKLFKTVFETPLRGEMN